MAAVQRNGDSGSSGSLKVYPIVLDGNKKVKFNVLEATLNANLALHKSAYATLGIPHHFDVLDLLVFREMVRKQAGKLLLIDTGRKAKRKKIRQTAALCVRAISHLPTKTLASWGILSSLRL
jgi:hypothetical protein